MKRKSLIFLLITCFIGLICGILYFFISKDLVVSLDNSGYKLTDQILKGEKIQGYGENEVENKYDIYTYEKNGIVMYIYLVMKRKIEK